MLLRTAGLNPHGVPLRDFESLASTVSPCPRKQEKVLITRAVLQFALKPPMERSGGGSRKRSKLATESHNNARLGW